MIIIIVSFSLLILIAMMFWRFWYRKSEETLRTTSAFLNRILNNDRDHRHIFANKSCIRDTGIAMGIQSILDAVTDGIVGVNHEGLVVFVNPAALKMLGYGEAELLGANFHDLVHRNAQGEHIPEVCEMLHAMASASGILQGETYFTDQQGNLFLAEYSLNNSSLTDVFVLVFRNISTRRETERQLQQEHDFRQKLIESLPGVFYVFDTLGYFHTWNRNFEEVTGRNIDEIDQSHPLDYFDTEEKPKVAETIQRVFTAGRATVEANFLAKNGNRIPYLFTGMNVDLNGRPMVIGLGIDISERKKAEQQLRKLAHAVEQSPESIVIADLEARIEYVNEAFERNTGYNRDEVLGQNPRILQSRKTPLETYRTLWDSLTSGRTWKGEFINRCKDGSEYVELAIISPLRQPDGHVSHYVAVKEDITQRKQMEIALRDSELRYRELAERSPLAIQVFSPGGKTLRVNQAWEKMWGVPFSALSQYNVLQDQQLATLGILPLLKRAFAGEAVQFPNHEYDKAGTDEVPHSGGKLWIHAFAYPVRDSSGNLLEIVVIQEDITERKQAEMALRRWAHIFEHAAWGIVVGSVDGQRIELANPAFCHERGYSVEEILRLPISGLFAPEERAKLPDYIRISHERGHYTFESMHLRKDGSTFPILADVTAVRDEQGKIQYRVVNTQDITERKRVEDELKRKMDELERFNRAMVGRELQMIALKREINELCQASGLPTRYVIRMANPPGDDKIYF